MRTSSLAFTAALWFAGVALTPALALDPKARLDPEASPLELFSLGFHAYQRGEKSRAFEALRYAADKGHLGARWKLGRMYAEGDGVPEDDYEAYKIFEGIVRDHEDGGANAAYVGSSIVALADYLKHGIPNSPVGVDLVRARQFYFHAASYFADPKAQFELGRMLLEGDGGRQNPRQAARWLKLASQKGDVRATALLGSLLFEGSRIGLPPQPTRGLGMLTSALKRASPTDEAWIRPLQEQAFSVASEAERRTALAYADQQMASASGSTTKAPGEAQ